MVIGSVAGYVVAVFAVVARTTVPSCHRAAPGHVYYDVCTRVCVCASVMSVCMSVCVSVCVSVFVSACLCHLFVGVSIWRPIALKLRVFEAVPGAFLISDDWLLYVHV